MFLSFVFFFFVVVRKVDGSVRSEIIKERSTSRSVRTEGSARLTIGHSNQEPQLNSWHQMA